MNKPFRNCQNPTVIQGVRLIIALLRCLFPERFPRVLHFRVEVGLHSSHQDSLIDQECLNTPAMGPGMRTNSETGDRMEVALRIKTATIGWPEGYPTMRRGP